MRDPRENPARGDIIETSYGSLLVVDDRDGQLVHYHRQSINRVHAEPVSARIGDWRAFTVGAAIVNVQ